MRLPSEAANTDSASANVPLAPPPPPSLAPAAAPAAPPPLPIIPSPSSDKPMLGIRLKAGTTIAPFANAPLPAPPAPGAPPPTTPAALIGAPPPGKAVPLPHIKVAPNVSEAALAKGLKPKKPRSMVILVGGPVAAGLLIAGIVYSCLIYFAPAPPVAVKPAPNPVATAPVGTGAAANTTPTTGNSTKARLTQTVDDVASAPAKLITRVQNAIQGQRNLEQDKVDAANLGEESNPATNPPPPVTTTPAVSDLKPVPTKIAPPPPAPLEFRTWVDSVKISGVRINQGRTVAIINNHVAHPGELIDASLGYIFDGVDTDEKTVVFRDHDGAKVSKPY